MQEAFGRKLNWDGVASLSRANTVDNPYDDVNDRIPGSRRDSLPFQSTIGNLDDTTESAWNFRHHMNNFHDQSTTEGSDDTGDEYQYNYNDDDNGYNYDFDAANPYSQPEDEDPDFDPTIEDGQLPNPADLIDIGHRRFDTLAPDSDVNYFNSMDELD
ncbi:hypothetical protein IWQ60_004089 [Tieghemiomyces parasiticus]|uniref:Uncharacterized protein n=1 Tax=Tieghemiomyces parasiticus TaxID=78921 RepID=A0A9W8AC33_9FUNG|nr:hypothetical protein IWQ60_004089 [Tieghemiomyces parasiticus]